MKLLLLFCLISLCSCASTGPIRYEQVGPVRAEVFKLRDGTCERRVYLDSIVYKTIVPCKK